MNEIRSLTDYQHARLRTEMYLGSRNSTISEFLLFGKNGVVIKELEWVPAIWSAFREILDNACDEVISHGYGSSIEVNFDKNNFSFSVKDDGRGIPIIWNSEENEYIPTLVMTKTKTGRNFGERNNVSGMNGIGASIVNFCSEYFKVEVHNSDRSFYQSFHEGNEIIDELMIEEPVVKKRKNRKTGTFVEFKLSKNVFPNLIIPEEIIYSHLYVLSSVNSKITIKYNGEIIKTEKNLLKSLFGEKEAYHLSRKNDNTSLNIVISPMLNTEITDKYFIFVNNISAFDGATFINEFKKHFFGKVADAISKKLRKKDVSVSRLDVQKNLIIFFDIKTKNPFFDSQSKTRFVSNHINDLISNFEENEIKKFISSVPSWIDYIENSILKRFEEKENRKTLEKLRKSKKEKPVKLLDASSMNREKCILFVSEGDSAISSLAAVRNPKIHAGFPLRGKVVNVYDVPTSKLVNNHDVVDLINCIGLNFTKKANISELRYGKVFLAHDADEDGLHIGALLINLFYKYWPELFVEPYFYVWQTPIIIAEKGKEMKFWFSDDYHEFDPEKYKGYSITRAKGLGSLTLAHWKYCLENPRLYPIVDDGKLSKTLEYIFSPERAQERKDWNFRND